MIFNSISILFNKWSIIVNHNAWYPRTEGNHYYQEIP